MDYCNQLSFFDRCEDFVLLVGQAIAFCGLSCLAKAQRPDRRQKPIVCPTVTTQLSCGYAALWGGQFRTQPAFRRPYRTRRESSHPASAG